MSTITEEWYFEDDCLYKCTPAPECGEDIKRRRLMMTKAVFQECFKRWILGKENSDDSN